MTSAARVDCHVKVLDEAVVEQAKRRGLDALVYAPHFTRWPSIEHRADAFSDDELTVVPGRELFTGSWRDRRHVLALDLERPVPDFCTLEGTMDELDRQDAVVLVPHPGYATVSFGREHVGTYRDQVDAVETHNAKFLPWHGRRARKIAADFDLPSFGSSYAHVPATIGHVWTTFDTTIAAPGDLHDAFRERVNRHVERRTGPAHVRQRAIEVGHLAWENSWEKFERLFLSGTEATHPAHVAYGGEFDDIRVY
ncbi:MAG: PHP domain-containing protein [Salinirussus sp.]